MVHITNGESVASELRRWAGEPRLIIWYDVLHEGPVREGLSFRELSRERAAWLGGESAEYGGFAERDQLIGRLAPRDSLWLWFEDDLYDQLQLLQVLDLLVHEGLTTSDHFLIDIPRGVRVEEMAGLAAAKRKISPAMFDTAVRAWTAFRSPDPGAVPALLSSYDLSPLPDLKPAFERLLEHRPQLPDGLNRTEREIVRILETGGRTAHDLFVRTQQAEERPFMGDTTFFWYLDRMAPLVQRDKTGIYSLHPGLRKAPQPRWVGGVLFDGSPDTQ